LEKIKKFLANTYKNKLTAEKFVNLTDFWDVSNRQAKFIINSVRAYEFFNYQWRIPLCDIELVSFWLKIPLKHRLENKLYNEYLISLFQQKNISFKRVKYQSHPTLAMIKRLSKSIFPKEIIDIYRQQMPLLQKDDLRFLTGIRLFFKKEKINTKHFFRKNINFYLAKLQINEIKNK